MSMVHSAKLVERYRALKAETPACLLLMQAGTFLQVQDEDARQKAVRMLDKVHSRSVSYAKEVSQ